MLVIEIYTNLFSDVSSLQRLSKLTSLTLIIFVQFFATAAVPFALSWRWRWSWIFFYSHKNQWLWKAHTHERGHKILMIMKSRRNKFSDLLKLLCLSNKFTRRCCGMENKSKRSKSRAWFHFLSIWASNCIRVLCTKFNMK